MSLRNRYAPVLLGAFGVVCIFLATAFAAPDAGLVITPDDPSTFLQTLLGALTGKHWIAVAALALVAGVWGLRRAAAFLGWAWLKWANTSRGGAVLALATSLAGAVAYAAVRGTLSPDTIMHALEVGFLAAGGWTAIRRIIGAAPPEAPKPGIGTVPVQPGAPSA